MIVLDQIYPNFRETLINVKGTRPIISLDIYIWSYMLLELPYFIILITFEHNKVRLSINFYLATSILLLNVQYLLSLVGLIIDKYLIIIITNNWSKKNYKIMLITFTLQLYKWLKFLQRLYQLTFILNQRRAHIT